MTKYTKKNFKYSLRNTIKYRGPGAKRPTTNFVGDRRSPVGHAYKARNLEKKFGGNITTFLEMYNNNQLSADYQLIIPEGTTEYYEDLGGVYMNTKKEKTPSIQQFPILRINRHKVGKLCNNSSDVVTKFSVEHHDSERTKIDYLVITDYHITSNEVITKHFYKASDVIVDENNKILDCNIKEYVKNYLLGNVLLLPTFLRDKHIGEWDVSNVTDMHELFDTFTEFNEDISAWNVSKVTNMSFMFTGCEEFNQPLNRWNVSKVTNMEGMFNDCIKFNKQLGEWNVSQVTNMKAMFSGCEIFNKPLGDWDVSQVTNMESMFFECLMFNQALVTWNVSNVTNMSYMFFKCEKFNKPLGDWDVSQVTNMESMFSGCEKFNQPLGNWDVSQVTIMSYMFYQCTAFNQPLNGWVINQNTGVVAMFDDCGISRINKPNIAVPPPPPQDVDPMQIHNESRKINTNKLNMLLSEFMKFMVEIPIVNNDYPTFFKDAFTSMIDEADPSDKPELRAKLERIMNELLNGLNYAVLNKEFLATAIKMVNYVNQQDKPLKIVYVTTFVEDCVTAYNGPDGMTCVMGALERIFFSFVTAASVVDINHPEWKQIVNCIVVNIKDMIIEDIKEWYQLHKTGLSNEFVKETDDKEINDNIRRDDLRKFLKSKYPEEGKLIDEQIKDVADNIGYDDGDFTFGGRKWRPITRKQLRNTRRKQLRNTRQRAEENKI